MAELFPQPELDFVPVNTHNKVCRFGKKHNGTKWTDIPVGYLRWIVNDVDKKDIVLLAKSELHRRGRLTEMPKLEISGHALDRISQRILKMWIEDTQPSKEPGLSSWAHETAAEAMVKGELLTDRSDEESKLFKYRGIIWIFAIKQEWPVLKSVRTK